MGILQKLGFGGGGNTTPSSDGANASSADDLASSREVIHNSSGDQYWAQFEETIKRLSPRELNMINYRLGAGVPDNSDWHDYMEAFRYFQWYRFCEAYHYVTRETFSV